MARPEYPLKALRELRDERVEAQQRSLAELLARTERALARLSERERARRDHAERTAEVLRAERERFTSSPVSGADLGRMVEFEAAARAQSQLLESAEREAREALARSRAEEQSAREELSRREAEAKLVRNHQAGFQQRAQDAAERAEEEAALEQWNARRS